MTTQKPAYKKINHTNYNLESLQNAMEHIPEEQDDPKGPTMGRDQLREVFEKAYANQVDLTPSKGTNSYYAHSGTEVMYRAFLHAVKEMRNAIRRTVKFPKGKPRNPFYINGMMVSDGTVQFSRRPRIYRDKTDCITECDRLHGTYGHMFATFEAVHLAGSVSCPVENSKQKENGAPRLNPYKVMEKLAKVRDQWNALGEAKTNYVMPEMIESSSDGKNIIHFSYPEKYPSMQFSTHAQAVYAVNGFIKDFLKTQSEQLTESTATELKLT